MSKKLALVDDAEPIPQFLRTVPEPVEAEQSASEVVAPLTEPKPEPVPEPRTEPEVQPDLDSMEAMVVAAAKEPLSVIKVAVTLRSEQAAKAREIRSTRAALIDRKELLMKLFEGAAAAIDERVADCDTALDYIANGIGQTDAA